MPGYLSSSHLYAKDPLYLQAPRTHNEQRQGHGCYRSATVHDLVAVIAVIAVGHGTTLRSLRFLVKDFFCFLPLRNGLMLHRTRLTEDFC
eukprot:s219_g12.t1